MVFDAHADVIRKKNN